ncbi:hypothetical protein DL240_09095 [Lujinxingia litoralis]|uniref:Uncharacterized protein n=1 Tax=Lujinxingia litoralis TaxID=2211119 RepID=A0A328C7H4_9DELT|nr:hypothetical protein [Lujinxingia litoralis]RAL23032.1 hypothetical protein DL240_09095 [Lujinxingia litoralis]
MDYENAKSPPYYKWMGGLCLSVGIPLGGWSVGILTSGYPEAKAWVLLFLAVIAAFVGLLMVLVPALPQDIRALTEDGERNTLAIARAREGRLSVVELALYGRVSLRDAQTILSHFEAEGYAYVIVSEEGVQHYVFPDFSPGPRELSESESENFMRRLAEAEAEVEVHG